MELPIGNLVFSFVVMIIVIIAMWKIFIKAGEPGWASLVPFYNLYIMLKIAGKPGWWILLIIFVPLVNIIFIIMMYHGLSKAFGKDVGFTLGLIFLSFIFFPILGFGNAEFIGYGGEPSGANARDHLVG